MIDDDWDDPSQMTAAQVEQELARVKALPPGESAYLRKLTVQYLEDRLKELRGSEDGDKR